ncbi:MAG: DUF4097 domain-containing protein [Coriobacteriales bacterium]|jgi:hypothetical protein|nr:DUF4097 domain-containing protein [Coriobacteriales bacterium]
MKKATRNLLIVALILILVGGILGRTGCALGGDTPIRMTKNGPVISSGKSGDLISVEDRWNTLTSLDIETDIIGLRLEEGESFSLHGSYDPALTQLEISESRGVLTIRSVDRREGWLNFDFFGSGQPMELVLTYPGKAKFKEVSIDSAVGSLKIADLTTESLTVSLDIGNFEGRNITADVFSADLNLGNCEIDGLNVTEKARATLSTGRLALDDSTVRNLSVRADLGSCSYAGTLKGAADFEMDTGALSLDLALSERDLSYAIESDTGRITLNGETLGSPVRSDVASPTLKLDIDSDLGAVKIRTD